MKKTQRSDGSDQSSRPNKKPRVKEPKVPLTVAGQLEGDALLREILRVCHHKVHEATILQEKFDLALARQPSPPSDDQVPIVLAFFISLPLPSPSPRPSIFCGLASIDALLESNGSPTSSRSPPRSSDSPTWSRSARSSTRRTRTGLSSGLTRPSGSLTLLLKLRTVQCY